MDSATLRYVGALAVVVASLSACTGGSNSSSDTTQSSPPTTSPTQGQTIVTSVTIDSAVPKSVAGTVTNVLSPNDSSSSVDSVTISTGGVNGESVVIATDSNNKILLAAFTSSDTTTLSVESTALALVRFAIGQVPPGMTAAQLNDAIRAAADYGPLQTQIGLALAAGTPLAATPAVAQELSTVLSQVARSIGAPVSANAGGGKIPTNIAPALVAIPQVLPPLPVTVVQDALLHLLPIQITDTDALGQVYVRNSMPIEWRARSYDAISGAEMTSPSSPFKLKPNTGTWVPGTGGQNFNLSIEQDVITQRDTLTNIIVDALRFELQFFPDSCADTVLRSSVEAYIDLLAALPSDATTLKEFIKGYFTLDTAKGVLSECLKRATTSAFLSAVITFLDDVALIQGVASAAFLAAEIEYALKFWGDPAHMVGVCFDNTKKIANCAASFTFAPSNLVAAIGADLTTATTMTAMDNHNPPSPTGIPAWLIYAKTDTGGVIGLNTATGVATATGIGSGSVTVKDPSTDAKGTYSVSVVDPVLCPNPIDIDLQTGTTTSVLVTLSDSSIPNCGGEAVFAAPNTIWSVSDPTVASLSLSLLTKCPHGAASCGAVSGLTPGQTTLTVTNGVTGEAITAQINVTAQTYWRASYTFQQCSPVPADAYPPPPFAQFYWENPCIDSYPPSAQAIGQFFFDDSSPDVVLQSDIFQNGHRVGGSRTIMPLGFKSSNDTFAFSVPTSYSVTLFDGVASASGSRSFQFNVISRSPTAMSGTFTLNTLSGYYVLGLPDNDLNSSSAKNFRTISTVGTGTWSASRVFGKKPTPTMNGFDFCFIGNFGLLNNGATGPCNPKVAPSNCAQPLVPDSCVFGPQ
jgi:hypothetical protein